MPRHHSTTPRRRVPVFPLAILILLLSSAPARAWGRLGHRVIARFAERHVSPEAKAAIAELLEPGESLADASTWADENRLHVHGSGVCHFANVPLSAPRYDDHLAGRGEIIPRIREFQSTLRDRSLPVAARRLALRFVVHLVEDLHQPLHVGDNQDRGGNALQVRFFRRATNLHHVWDTLILEHGGRDEDRRLTDLVAMDNVYDLNDAMDGSLEDWASESLRAARQAYQDPTAVRRIEPGAVLGQPYYEAKSPRRQVDAEATVTCDLATGSSHPR